MKLPLELIVKLPDEFKNADSPPIRKLNWLQSELTWWVWPCEMAGIDSYLVTCLHPSHFLNGVFDIVCSQKTWDTCLILEYLIRETIGVDQN